MEKCGYSQCLAGLRNRLNAGSSSYEAFVCAAAKTYLLLGKPFRARTLLQTVELNKTSPALRELLVALKNRASAMAIQSSASCSLTMIVKNECLNIGPALDSIDDDMDEIVVCDTGSTDQTREIARLYGATVLSINWSDDFSAARNEAIKAASCPWIFWMDADDRFDGASKRQLNTLLKTGMPQAASFCIINEQNNLPGAQFMQVRLFPRMEGLFFERRIHEQIMFGALRRKIPFTQYPSIRILHKGYNDPTMIQAKSARNKPLILSELKNQPNDPALLLNYGDCCVALGQLDGAYAAYSLIASNKDVRQAHPDVYVQAHLNIGCICNKRKDFAFAKHWFSQCIRLDSTRTDAYYFLGRILEAQGEEELAFENYLMSARLSPPPRQTATNVRKIRIESIHCLARLMLASRRLSEAELLLIHAIAAFPEVVEFHTALGNALLMQQKFKDAAHFFMQSLSLSNEGNRESYEGMAKIYETVGDFGAAKEFLEMAAR